MYSGLFFNVERGGGGKCPPSFWKIFGSAQAENVSENVGFNSDILTPRWVCTPPPPQDFAPPLR